MRAVLQPLGSGPAIKFDKPILLVGRHPDCDIVLLQSRKISRKHCILALVHDHIVVRDLESMNGVRINEKIISREGILKIGDSVQFGDIAFKLTVDDASNIKNKNLMEGISTERVTTAADVDEDAGVKDVPTPSGSQHPGSVIVDDPDEDSQEFLIPPMN
ncbi:FHA domain-containing protein [Lacunimicrobium album]